MTRLDSNPGTWLPEMHAVLAAMAKALDGRQPGPKLLGDLLPLYEDCFPAHKVTIEWFPEGYSADPALRPEYAILLSGDRFKAGWLILESDLYRTLQGKISN